MKEKLIQIGIGIFLMIVSVSSTYFIFRIINNILKTVQVLKVNRLILS